MCEGNLVVIFVILDEGMIMRGKERTTLDFLQLVQNRCGDRCSIVRRGSATCFQNVQLIHQIGQISKEIIQ